MTTTETQLGKIQVLLREASAATGHPMSPEVVGRLSVQVQRIMRETKLTLIWDRTIEELAAEMAADLLSGK